MSEDDNSVANQTGIWDPEKKTFTPFPKVARTEPVTITPEQTRHPASNTSEELAFLKRVEQDFSRIKGPLEPQTKVDYEALAQLPTQKPEVTDSISPVDASHQKD